MRFQPVLPCVCLLLSLTSGCAPTPTQAQINAADYGAVLSQRDAEREVRGFFAYYLKDPYSARYSFGPIHRGYQVGSVFDGAKLNGGYEVNVAVNAKNAFGGYVGVRPYRFLIKDDKILGAWLIRPSGYLKKIS